MNWCSFLFVTIGQHPGGNHDSNRTHRIDWLQRMRGCGRCV